MTTAALALVLASAVIHATWNFQVKQSGHKVMFFWTMAAVGLVAVGPAAIAFALIDGFGWKQLAFSLGTSALHSLYAIFLTRGYYSGDLSTFYPVSRGMGPALVPIAAVIIFGESVSALAIAGIVLVVIGIYTIHIDQRLIRDLSHPLRALAAPGTRIALLTGLVICSYSIWDKAGLNNGVPPITLNGFTVIGNFAGLTPAIFRAADRSHLGHQWREQKLSIITAGILAPLGYALVLIALTTSQVSYVAPAREVGIVFGTAAGVFILHEGFGLTRIWGALLIVVGVVTLAVAP